MPSNKPNQKPFNFSKISVCLAMSAFISLGHLILSEAAYADVDHATTSIFFGMTTGAEDGDPQSLKNTMKEIGKNFKLIGGSFSDASQADANAARANRVAELLTLALDKTPDKIDQLPASEQADALKRFQDEIKNMISLVRELAADLQAKKMDALSAIMSKIKDAKQKGHDEFKEEDNGH